MFFFLSAHRTVARNNKHVTNVSELQLFIVNMM